MAKSPFQERKEKNEEKTLPIPSAVYKNLIDTSIYSNVEIDDHSLVLLNKGPKGQRYVVVVFVVDEKKVSHVYLRPTFEGPKSGETQEEKQKRIASEPNRKLFDEKDIIESNDSNPGIVHTTLIEMVEYQNLLEGNPYKDHLKSGKKMGLSFYKFMDSNILTWVERSTRNYTVAEVESLPATIYHFSEVQTHFSCPSHTRIYNLNRTLPGDLAEAFIRAFDREVCKKNGIPQNHPRKLLLNTLLKQFRIRSDSTKAEEEWKDVRSSPKKLAEKIMHTVYYASGMNTVDIHAGQQPFQPKNSDLIKEAFSVAKKYSIKLNINYIPADDIYKTHHQFHRRPALWNAIFLDDLDSIKSIFSYDKEKALLYKDSLGFTSLEYAISLKNTCGQSIYLKRELKQMIKLWLQ